MADMEHIVLQPFERKAWSSDDYFIVSMSVAVGLTQSCNWKKCPGGAKLACTISIGIGSLILLCRSLGL